MKDNFKKKISLILAIIATSLAVFEPDVVYDTTIHEFEPTLLQVIVTIILFTLLIINNNEMKQAFKTFILKTIYVLKGGA